MPAELKVTDSGIYRYKDAQSQDGECVSNFTLALLAKVNVDLDAGGPGFLVRLKRFPDNIER